VPLPRPRFRDRVETDPGYHRLLEAIAHGEQDRALHLADALLAEAAADADRRRWIPATQLALGSLHADAERFELAAVMLHEGLGALADTGTAHLVPDADWYVLRLVDVELQLGRYAAAATRLPPLLEPTRAVETRLGATRVEVQLAITLGDFERAHHHLNTAAGLAERARNRFLGALVDADRAMLLAVQDRGHEAMANADRVLPSLAGPGSSPFTVWANRQAVACASLLARRASFAGNASHANRYAAVAAEVAPRTRSMLSRALANQALAAAAMVDGRREEADALLLDAIAGLQRLGTVPATADAVADRGRLALATGLTSTARPVLEHALSLYAGIGQRSGAAEVRRLLERLPADRS
jgi:tetratricopeptide (TPR) repeat protein